TCIDRINNKNLDSMSEALEAKLGKLVVATPISLNYQNLFYYSIFYPLTCIDRINNKFNYMFN
ncbi:hypothetical protein ACJX0J_006231, partial [Zea mays]